MLKNRMSAYSEADLLFEEKDEEIHKLQAELSDTQMKSYLKHTELKK